MKCTLALSLALIAVTGCTNQQRNPDQIRKETADATSTAAKDAKAVAQGVSDGLKQKGPINVNRASPDDLKTPARNRRGGGASDHRQPALR